MTAKRVLVRPQGLSPGRVPPLLHALATPLTPTSRRLIVVVKSPLICRVVGRNGEAILLRCPICHINKVFFNETQVFLRHFYIKCRANWNFNLMILTQVIFRFMYSTFCLRLNFCFQRKCFRFQPL